MSGTMSLPDEAPDFHLYDQNLVVRSLKDFKGRKTVLAFFPGAFTDVCTREMCVFRDSMKSMIEFGAQIVGICVNDPFTNKAFANALRLPFVILSDYTRETIKEYDVFHEDYAGLKGYTVAKRSVFILDQEGKLQYKWITENPALEPIYNEITDEVGRSRVQ
jgi:peroxiredoxin